MPTTRLCTTLLITAALLYMPLAHAEIYQWVDANGMTHFSDKPRKSGPSKVILKAKAVKKVVRRKAVPERPANRPAKQVRRVTKPRRLSKPARETRPVRTRKPVRVLKPIRINKPVRSARTAEKSRPLHTKKPLRVQKRKRVEKVIHAATLHASLDATSYDIERIAVRQPEIEVELEPEFESPAEQPQTKVITSIKATLCTDKRQLLAALQEKGFQSYYDEAGDHRVAWGVEGFYREKRRYLTSTEVANKTKNVQLEVAEYCDKPNDLLLQEKSRADWIRAEYCKVSKAILADLNHPFMRASNQDIQDQTQEVKRFCTQYHSEKFRNDERYFPKTLQIKSLQQKHFLYR